MSRREYHPRLRKTNALTVGLDLGDRRHTACVLDEAGNLVAEAAIPHTREVPTAFGARSPGATFVMETGTYSPRVSRLLSAHGHPVIVTRRTGPVALSPGKNQPAKAQPSKVGS